MTETKNFLGIPVEGEINKSRSRQVEQWGQEKFAELIRPLLDSDEVEAVRWTQYTPFFNDGEVCEFSTGELYVKLRDDDESGDYDDGFMDSIDLGHNKSRSLTTLDVFSGLGEAFDAGRFESFLYDQFGDHAEVTITKDKVSIASYDHD